MFARPVLAASLVPTLASALACTMPNLAFDPADESGSADEATTKVTDTAADSGTSDSGSSTNDSGSSTSDSGSESDSETGAMVGCMPAPEGMVCIAGGPTQIGCFLQGTDCSGDELPLHQVELSSYFIDLDEVTVGDWQYCVDDQACDIPGEGVDGCTWSQADPMLPINCVTWDQAQAFCAHEGKRLPTEAEWERAATGPTPNIYPWGSDPPTCGHAITGSCPNPKPMPVGSAPLGTSPEGLRDTIGNVGEWVSDWHANNYNGSETVDPQGPALGNNKVVRGASFQTVSPSELEAYDRGLPASPDNVSLAHGLRCAQSVYR